MEGSRLRLVHFFCLVSLYVALVHTCVACYILTSFFAINHTTIQQLPAGRCSGKEGGVALHTPGRTHAGGAFLECRDVPPARVSCPCWLRDTPSLCRLGLPDSDRHAKREMTAHYLASSASPHSTTLTDTSSRFPCQSRTSSRTRGS